MVANGYMSYLSGRIGINANCYIMYLSGLNTNSKIYLMDSNCGFLVPKTRGFSLFLKQRVWQFLKLSDYQSFFLELKFGLYQKAKKVLD